MFRRTGREVTDINEKPQKQDGITFIEQSKRQCEAEQRSEEVNSLGPMLFSKDGANNGGNCVK